MRRNQISSSGETGESLNRQVLQFSRLLVAEVCASAVVMLDTPSFRGSVKSTGYPLHSPVSPSLPLPYLTVCHQISTGLYNRPHPCLHVSSVAPHLTFQRNTLYVMLSTLADRLLSRLSRFFILSCLPFRSCNTHACRSLNALG
jgi:hypothetical protein